MGNYDINFAPDQSYISNRGGKSYMAGVSPWFFTVSLALRAPENGSLD